MGHPWHEIRHLEQQAGLVALSANFTLYGDMSDRMMSLAAGLGPAQEIYSIDLSAPGYCCVSLAVATIARKPSGHLGEYFGANPLVWCLKNR